MKIVVLANSPAAAQQLCALDWHDLRALCDADLGFPLGDHLSRLRARHENCFGS